MCIYPDIPRHPAETNHRNEVGVSFGQVLSDDETKAVPSAPLFHDVQEREAVEAVVIVGRPPNTSKHVTDSKILSQSDVIREMLQVARQSLLCHYFQSRFNGNVPCKVVEMPDLLPEIFDKMLAYLSNGKITFESPSSALEILYGSFRYGVYGLVTECLKYLLTAVDRTNARLVLHGIEVNLKDLEDDHITDLRSKCCRFLEHSSTKDDVVNKEGGKGNENTLLNPTDTLKIPERSFNESSNGQNTSEDHTELTRNPTNQPSRRHSRSASKTCSKKIVKALIWVMKGIGRVLD